MAAQKSRSPAALDESAAAVWSSVVTTPVLPLPIVDSAARVAFSAASASFRTISVATSAGTETTTAATPRPPSAKNARRWVRRDERRHADTPMTSATAAAARLGKPWNSSEGQRSTTWTPSAPMTAPNRRRARDENTVENAATTVRAAGTSSQPRESSTAATPRTIHVPRDERLVSTVNPAANAAVSIGSAMAVPVG